MNQALFLAELRKICLVVIAYCAGKGWLTPADSSLIGGLLPAFGLLAGPWLWGLYTMVNKKLVPADSIAIAPEHVLNKISAATPGGLAAVVGNDEQSKPVFAKVVGALLFAFILASLLISPAFAEIVRPTGNVIKDLSVLATPRLSPSASTSTVDSALSSFGAEIQKIEKSIVDKGIADLNAAIQDATNHNDNISLPCWKANLALLQSLPSQWSAPPEMPMGIALSIQVQRDLLNSITGNDPTSLKVACAALWGDQLRILANVGTLIGLRIATGGAF